MKKRVLEVVTLFLLVVVIVYGQAVLTPQENKLPKNEDQETAQVVTPLPYTKLKDNYYSQLIGAKKSDVYELLGQPKEVSQENEAYELFDYGANQNKFLQIRLKNNRVEEILSLGLKEKNSPFKIGMTESSLSELTTLNSNYELGEDLAFELAEEDINYRPLVAFENDSFAIFYFDPISNELLAISYLSKERLQEKMPYQITKGQKESVLFSKESEKAQKETQLFSDNYRKVVNHLRQKQKLVTFGNLYDNDEAAKKALIQLNQNQEKLLKKDTFQRLKEKKMLNQRLLIDGKELDALGEKLELPTISSGILKMNVQDSFAEALEDFMFPPLNRQFHKETNDIFSVATANQNMIVLLSETKVTQDSSKEVEE